MNSRPLRNQSDNKIFQLNEILNCKRFHMGRREVNLSGHAHSERPFELMSAVAGVMWKSSATNAVNGGDRKINTAFISANF